MFSKISFLQCMMLMGIVLLSSCKKDSKDPDNVSDAEYYFYGKLDGQTNLLEIDATGDYQMSNSIDASIGVPFCTYSYGCAIGAFDPIDAPYFEVYFPNLFDGDCADVDQDFSGLFHTGAYSFGDLTGQVLVRHWDGTELWTSDASGQVNASFEVTATERQETPFGIYQKVSGKASCTLFNMGGSSKKLEDIKFVMSFSKD